MANHSALKQWRLQMQMCLLKIEQYEDRTTTIKNLPDPLAMEMDNLFQEFRRIKGWR